MRLTNGHKNKVADYTDYGQVGLGKCPIKAVRIDAKIRRHCVGCLILMDTCV